MTGYSLLQFSLQSITVLFTVYYSLIYSLLQVYFTVCYSLVYSLLQSYSKCPPLAARHFWALYLNSKIAFWETEGSRATISLQVRTVFPL